MKAFKTVLGIAGVVIPVIIKFLEDYNKEESVKNS